MQLFKYGITFLAAIGNTVDILKYSTGWGKCFIARTPNARLNKILPVFICLNSICGGTLILSSSYTGNIRLCFSFICFISSRFFRIIIGYFFFRSYKKANKENIKRENKRKFEQYVKSDEEIEKKKSELRQLLESEADYKEFKDTITTPANEQQNTNSEPINVINTEYWNSNEEDDFLDGFN